MPREFLRELASEYENVREVLDPRYSKLSSREIESLLSKHNVDAEAMEEWFGAIASLLPKVLPVVGKIAGGLFGGGSSAPAPPPQAQTAPPAPPAPVGAMPFAGAAPAAGQLMQTMLRPETMQALMSMLMGQHGRANVQVGSTPVPVGAFTNLLGVLANQAASEYNAATSTARDTLPEYLRDYAGEAVTDVAVAENRARALS